MPHQFSSEMSVVTTRREERLPVDVRARYGHSGMPTRTLCRVADITRHGAKLTIYCDLRRDTVIRLALPRGDTVRARIVWCNEVEAGCVFETPLTQAVLNSVLEASEY